MLFCGTGGYGAEQEDIGTAGHGGALEGGTLVGHRWWDTGGETRNLSECVKTQQGININQHIWVESNAKQKTVY